MEILIWIGFLIVYSIVQSLNKKKKKQSQPVPGTADADASRAPTIQDVLSEIQAALEGKPAPEKPAEPKPQDTMLPAPASPRPQLQPREPEFHSLEKQIPDRLLESKTKYETKIFTQKARGKSTSYDDTFPESTFYDDAYHHPHMDASTSDMLPVTKKKKSTASLLRARLKNGNYLSEAFILQQIVGKPLSKK